MNSKEESWIVAMRAMAMSKLLLTEREDLEIVDGHRADHYDLLVHVLTDQSLLEPSFAIVVKGTRRNVTSQQLGQWLSTNHAISRDLTIPWCLFVFHVESRQGMYCWLAEPRVTEDGKPTLITSSEQSFLNQELRLLDLEALDSIVHAVIHWTKAVEQTHLMQVRAS